MEFSNSTCADVYRIPKTFPDQERFGLINQMRRAVVRIPSDIAEGPARQRPKEFIQYVHASQVALRQLDTLLEFANRLRWLQKKDGDGLESTMNRMDKMLSGLFLHQKLSRPSRLTPHEKTNPQSIRKGVE